MRFRFDLPFRLAIVVVTAALGASSYALVGGTADPGGSVYQYVGLMSNGFAGTPIASNWFVTANHIAPSVGNTYTNPDGTFVITNVVPVPNGVGGTTDLSLVQVGGTFTHIYGYGSAPVGADPLANGTGGTNGTLTTIVGYGANSSGIGVAPGNGIGRTTVTNTVDALITTSFDNVNTWRAYAYDLDNGTAANNVTGNMNGTSREGGLAGGDSGGSWFISSASALPTVIAISSGVESQFDATGAGNTNYWQAGGIGVGVSLGAYSSFIRTTTGVAPVPEPSAFAVLGLGAAALLRRRKR